MNFLSITEQAAIACHDWIGKGDRKAADKAATDAMRKAFNLLDIHGKVVIGEGERDKAPMLFIGEELGTKNGPEIDIAVDPLEGTNMCAMNLPNSISVFAYAPRGNLLGAPDTYMNKIAVGSKAKGAIDLSKTPKENILSVAEKLGKKPEEMVIIAMDRDRNAELIKQIHETGAKTKLIKDGDVFGAISTCFPNLKIDMLMGIGAAPEGVLAAACIKAMDGDFQGKLWFKKDKDQERAKKMGIEDLNKIFTINEIVKGDDVKFFATGVTDGDILQGIKKTDNKITTHSLVTDNKTKTIRFIKTTRVI